MKKIKSIYLHLLRNDEHFLFMQFTLALTKEIGATALKVEPQPGTPTSPAASTSASTS